MAIVKDKGSLSTRGMILVVILGALLGRDPEGLQGLLRVVYRTSGRVRGTLGVSSTLYWGKVDGVA